MIATATGQRETTVARQKVRGTCPHSWWNALDKPPGQSNGHRPTPVHEVATSGTKITFHAGFHFDGLDATAIVRHGNPENVDRFLAWCRAMALDAQRAAKEAATSASSPPILEPEAHQVTPRADDQSKSTG